MLGIMMLIINAMTKKVLNGEHQDVIPHLIRFQDLIERQAAFFVFIVVLFWPLFVWGSLKTYAINWYEYIKYKYEWAVVRYAYRIIQRRDAREQILPE